MPAIFRSYTTTEAARHSKCKSRFMRITTLIMFAGLIIACRSSTGPSPLPSPAPASDTLVIVPAITGLKVGETQTLNAVIVPGQRSVAPSWSTDAADVVTIQPDGVVHGARLGSSTIHAVYQALSASLALRVVPDYSGSWSGQYHVTGCVRAAGNGPDNCKFDLAAGGSVLPFAFTLGQNGDAPTGTLQFMDNTGQQVVETGPVSGTIDTLNALSLAGTTYTTDPSEPRQRTLSGWSTSLATDGGMVGRFTEIRDFQNAWGRQQIKLDCELVNVRRNLEPDR